MQMLRSAPDYPHDVSSPRQAAVCSRLGSSSGRFWYCSADQPPAVGLCLPPYQLPAPQYFFRSCVAVHNESNSPRYFLAL